MRWGGLLLLIACKIPSTLGLPCNEDEHCDSGQYCSVDEICESGSAPVGTGTTDATTMAPTTVDPSTSSTTTAMTATLSASGGASTTTNAETSTSTTTGPQCGAAVGSCDQLDVLFLIDNSSSMEEDFATLLPAFTDFDALAESFIDGLCSWQLGVTTTDVAPDYQPEECQLRGALNRSGALAGPDGCFPADPDHPPYVTEDDALQSLGCFLAVGNNYDDDEKQIDTVLAALGPDLAAAGACNEGFLRDDAALLVVIVTDEDDDDDSLTPGEDVTRTGSMGGPGEWFDELIALKPASNLGVILIAGTEDGGCDWMPASGGADGSGAEYPERLLTFLQYFSGSGYIDHIQSANICGTGAELMGAVEAFQSVVAAVCEDAVFE